MKFSEKGSNPEKFRRSVSNGFIFSFSTRPSNGRLLLGAPGYEIVAKVDQESAGRATIRGVADPIRVTERGKEHRRCTIVV